MKTRSKYRSANLCVHKEITHERLSDYDVDEKREQMALTRLEDKRNLGETLTKNNKKKLKLTLTTTKNFFLARFPYQQLFNQIQSE